MVVAVGSTLIARNRFGGGKIICSGLAQDIIKSGFLKWQRSDVDPRKLLSICFSVCVYQRWMHHRYVGQTLD